MKTQIDKIGRVTLSTLEPLLKAAMSREDGVLLKVEFALQGISYKVYASKEWSYLLFRYIDRDGEKQNKRVELYRAASNLGRGSVLYFLCPYTGHKCRKLFCDGRVIASRYAFSHVYSYQNESRKERTLSKLFAESPERKGGKIIYKGKLTRYGRKLLLYHEKAEERARRIEELLIVKPMGRPKKKDLQKRVEF